jgi:phosphotransferase system  glucose/maltose/N-acetylglucosamine-specific IIC component
VIAGIIVWMLHERFHNIRLPDALAFLAPALYRLSPPWFSAWSVWSSADLARLRHGD